MFKATSFYYGNFFTGKTAEGKVYVYKTGTTELATIYNENGDTITNPVSFTNHYANFLVEDDLVYRIVIKDLNDETKIDMDNIQQMKGQRGPSGGPKGEKGDRGRQGEQGISGVRGLDGFTGSRGFKGLPYLTKKSFINNELYTIPAGTSEIFVTASGGGGAAASYSNFMYTYSVKSQNQQSGSTKILNLYYKEDGDTNDKYSTNSYEFSNRDLCALYLTPGSGFAGESCYRKKIVIEDTTKEHTLQVFIGTGGKSRANNLSGGAGSETKVYLDNKLVLTLKGGDGGEQQLPINAEQDVKVDSIVRLNKGFRNGLIYNKLTNTTKNNTNNYRDNYGAKQADYFKTTYKKKSGDLYVWTPVSISYFVKYHELSVQSNWSSNFFTQETRTANGQDSIFGSIYSRRQASDDGAGANNLVNSIKTYNSDSDLGYGSGGDAFLNVKGQNALFSSNKMDYYGYLSKIMYIEADFYIAFEEAQEIKDIVKNSIINFNNVDAYASGVADSPPKDDDPNFWTAIDVSFTAIDNAIASGMLNVTVWNDGLKEMNSKLPIQPSKQASANGGDGVQGHCYIEFGNITNK